MTLIVFYLIFLFLREKKDVKRFLLTGLSVFYGLIISSFYWLPIILEKKYIITSVFADSFSFEKSITAFLYSPWRFGFLFQGPEGQLSYLLGYVQILMVATAIFLLIRGEFKKNEKYIVVFYLLYFLSVFLLLQPVSKPLWDIIPFYKSLQFANRLMFIMVFLTAAIAGLVVKKIRNDYLVSFILFLAIFSTILNWGHRRVIPTINDSVLRSYLTQSTYLVEGGGPAAPVWVNKKGNPWQKDTPKSHIEVLMGDAKIKQTKRTSIDHRYVITAKSDSYIKENTYYFPSWTLKIDGKISSMDYTSKKYSGIITFNVKKGTHTVELSFLDTPLRSGLKTLSLISLLGLFICYFFLSRKVKTGKLTL
jgi:hypothetical protein